MTDLYSVALLVVKTLKQAGYIAWFAGGWVRDFLMKRPSEDIDIVTNASVAEIQTLFPKTIPVGIQFGIVIVVENGHQFEVATFRKDRTSLDGRHPSGVDRATPKEDAKRRDFTINGMFYDPINHVLYDYIDGRKDLKKKYIRAIGNPDIRFLEDRLRMVRAIRYATRFDFTIEKQTAAAILAHANTLLPAVSIERIWNELSKMAHFPHFNRALNTLHHLGLLPVIFPKLQGLSTKDMANRTALLPFFPQNAPLIAKILELFPCASIQEKEALCSYLKRSKQEVLFVRYQHHARNLFQSEEKRELYEWAHLYAHPQYSLCLTLEALHLPLHEREKFLETHEKQSNRLNTAIARIKNHTPLVTSSDLRKIGVMNGPQMGHLLKEGERLAINEEIEDPKQVIEKLFPIKDE